MILVTGAGGNVGRELTALLPDAKTLDRRAGADLAKPETLDLDGVDSVFLIWPFLTSDGAPAALARIAEQARRVVYLSSSAVRFGAGTDPITRLHADLEAAVQESGLEWTILRADTFASNALGWAGQLRAGDSQHAGALPPMMFAPAHFEHTIGQRLCCACRTAPWASSTPRSSPPPSANRFS